jgi:hypothetical protein
MRVNSLDNLAVELEYETQHAVSCRVLGPEIDGEIANSRFGHSDPKSAEGATPDALRRFQDDQDATSNVAFSKLTFCCVKARRSELTPVCYPETNESLARLA